MKKFMFDVCSGTENKRDDFAADYPLYFGKTKSGAPIYYDISADVEKNRHLLISGKSENDRTDAMTRLIMSCRCEQLPVIVFDFTGAYASLPDAECIDVSGYWEEHQGSTPKGLYASALDENKLLILDFSLFFEGDLDLWTNGMILTLFEVMKARRKNGITKPCVLFIDEVQKMDVSVSSTFSKVLRECRNYGLTIIAATQYLNGNGYTKLFEQFKGFMMFKQTGSSAAVQTNFFNEDAKAELKDCLISLQVGQALVKGSFSTDRCHIDYPVVVNIDPVKQSDTVINVEADAPRSLK